MPSSSLTLYDDDPYNLEPLMLEDPLPVGEILDLDLSASEIESPYGVGWDRDHEVVFHYDYHPRGFLAQAWDSKTDYEYDSFGLPEAITTAGQTRTLSRAGDVLDNSDAADGCRRPDDRHSRKRPLSDAAVRSNGVCHRE